VAVYGKLLLLALSAQGGDANQAAAEQPHRAGNGNRVGGCAMDFYQAGFLVIDDQLQPLIRSTVINRIRGVKAADDKKLVALSIGDLQ
jgi:hypothetical protein